MFGDRKPYLFKTSDYGKTWTNISKGIPMDEYTRVLREDPNKAGLLYAGTERGIYVSFDDGETWSSLNMNLPITSIRDLQVQKREKDLVVATHGLSFWVLDDLTPLYEIKDKNVDLNKSEYLFKPRHAYRMQGGGSSRRGGGAVGTNAENGVLVNYYFQNKPTDEVKIQFLSMSNDTIITYSTKKDLKGEPFKVNKNFYEDEEAVKPNSLPAQAGFNHFVWNMRYADATEIKGEKSPMWAGGLSGPKVSPGNYKVRLIAGDIILKEESFEIMKDPRVETSLADLKEQERFSLQIHQKLDESHKNINQVRAIRGSVNNYMKGLKDSTLVKKFEELTKPMLKKLDEVEKALVQNKAKAVQDLLAYPIRLNDKMAGLASVVESAETKPTAASYVVYQDLAAKIDATSTALKEIVSKDVPAFNDMVKENQLPAVNLE
jgi:hypothetical protein